MDYDRTQPSTADVTNTASRVWLNSTPSSLHHKVPVQKGVVTYGGIMSCGGFRPVSSKEGFWPRGFTYGAVMSGVRYCSCFSFWVTARI